MRNCAKVIFLRLCSKDLCLFAVSDALLGFLIRMPKPSRVGTDCFSLSLFVSFREMDDDDMKPEVKEGTEKGKNRTCIPLANRVLRTHTHTCSEISYRITDVECIKRAKKHLS